MVDSTNGGKKTGPRGSNQSGLRAHNERLVLTLIRQHGALSKAEIARLTGLSAQTVSVIMRELEADGLIQRGEPVRGRVGQPSVPMSIAPEGAFFLGLKVGRRSLDLILTDFNGRIRERRMRTHAHPTPEGVVRFANEQIDDILQSLTLEQRGRIAGLGIGMPFRLWEWAVPLGVAQADMDPWREADVVAEIASEWEFPVFLRNDASAACGAELVFGVGQRPRDFLYYFIGFFAGGGVVLNNTLFIGNTGNAGAVGSLPVGWSETGVPVQLIDVASLVLLEREVIKAGGSQDDLWLNPKAWSVDEALLTRWISTASDGLARASLAASTVFDFEAVIIDGWLPAEVRAALVAQTKMKLEAISIPGIEEPQVQAGVIGADARALGAASLPLSERFLLDQNALLG